MGLKNYFDSSIGKKQLMAITGLGLSLFVLIHMAGNLLVLVGADAYNAYGNAIVTSPILYPAEIGLVLLFLVHLGTAIRLTLENRRARPERYHACPKQGRGKITLASKTLIYTGLLVFVFLVLHLKSFKYGPHYTTTVNGKEMRDLYQLIQEIFRDPGYVVWYVFSVVVLGLHLSHGVSSTFQTLGWNHPNANICLKRFGCGFAALVTLGFLAVPVFIFFRG